MHRKVKDIAGQRFGRLVVLRFIETKNEASFWECLCDCGNIKNICRASLVKGAAKSCGCISREKASERCKAMKTHGDTNSIEYNTWRGVKERTTNKNHKQYIDYGGRGITMCDEWLNSYEAFLRDMGRKPNPDHSLDRIDNSIGYNKDNCQWRTRSEQNNNKRNNIKVRHKVTGEVYNSISLAEKANGYRTNAVWQQLRLGSKCDFVRI